MLSFSPSFLLPFFTRLDARQSPDLPIFAKPPIAEDQSAFGAVDAAVEPITFFQSWSLLGPFQIGTREAAWGADPLEYYGGFPKLEIHNDAEFKSSLASNGTATWSYVGAKSVENIISGAKTSLSINFNNVDWKFLQTVYGWSAQQYQAWARGEFMVNGDRERTLVFYSDNVLEYAIDGVRHFGGDFYSFRKAPLVLHLAPGRHVIDLRLVRDVRAMGGIAAPTIDVNLELKIVSGDVEIGNQAAMVSDVVDGRIASPYGSVNVRNNGKEWIEIFSISDSRQNNDMQTHLVHKPARLIAPGQTRPVVFHISVKQTNTTGPLPDTAVTLKYRVKVKDEPVYELIFPLKLERRSIHEPHKVTHLHPGGIVSYAILRPPSANATCIRNGTSAAPVMLQFHGAGVEADNPMVSHALDPVPELCAWVLFPTGVTPWSADDWHNWGFADVEAAVAAIPGWIQATGWRGVGVDIEKWLVSGHSNGGQGSWYALTHRPDRIFAGSPVSGYLSIHSYVPYQFWRSMDPRKRAVIEAAANSYRHELLAGNVKGIHLFQQHGSIDDNVPAYHSRLMSHLITEAGWGSVYSEVPGKNHWWENVMTTDGLREFYRSQLVDPKISFDSLNDFEVVCANPGDMGSKGGVEVLYLEDPGLLGKIRASINRARDYWSLETGNVLAFQLEEQSYRSATIVEIDGQEISLPHVGVAGKKEVWQFSKRGDGSWMLETLPGRLRLRSHLGGIDALLRSNGSFKIVHDGPANFFLALQISRNLQQYFAADAEIRNALSASEDVPTNVITVSTSESLATGHDFPIRVEKSKVYVRNAEGKVREYGANDADLGVIFVQPHALIESSLELVIWGRSSLGVARAARLAPLMTGIGQPDFVILDGSSSWKGADGTSLGFFDAHWNITSSSVFSWAGHRLNVK